jgi:hypothetical protein
MTKQQHDESAEREQERRQEAIPPWLDEEEIAALEYDSDDPWIEESKKEAGVDTDSVITGEGYYDELCAAAEKEFEEMQHYREEHPQGPAEDEYSF